MVEFLILTILNVFLNELKTYKKTRNSGASFWTKRSYVNKSVLTYVSSYEFFKFPLIDSQHIGETESQTRKANAMANAMVGSLLLWIISVCLQEQGNWWQIAR